MQLRVAEDKLARLELEISSYKERQSVPRMVATYLPRD
jgi:hypothetical protein